MRNHRYTVTTCLIAVVVLLPNIVQPAEKKKAKPISPAPTDLFEIRNIEGWAVYIKKQDLLDRTEEMNKAIDHLQNQLYQTRLVVPAPAVAIMQERVPFWMEYDSGPGLSFHPSYRWLLNRGYPSPEGLKSLVSNCPRQKFL